MSDESRQKLSRAVSGKRNHRFGKPMREEIKEKISLAQRGEKNHQFGKQLTDATKKKLSLALSGEKNPMYGKHRSSEVKAALSAYHTGRSMPSETREKISCSLSGENNPFFGKHHTNESRIKMSDAKRGEKSVFWQGGISFEPYCPKFNRDLKRRVRDYFGNTCIVCGARGDELKKQLHVHHVEYDKSACCDGKPVQFAALCQRCHARTNRDRDRWESMLHRVIAEVYDERSYFTKDEWKAKVKEESI